MSWLDKPINMESWGVWGLCVLWSSIFPSGTGAREASPTAFTPYLSRLHLCCAVGRTLLLLLQWKRLGAVGLNGDLGRAVVLSYQRAAIFGFQISIVKQIPFDSSAAGQIPSCVDCRVWNT